VPDSGPVDVCADLFFEAKLDFVFLRARPMLFPIAPQLLASDFQF
jgi:hypothetical protein